MKKTRIRTALALLLMLSLMLTGCVGAGFGNSDEHEEYNPNKKPGNDQFDFPGNYVAPELKIDGLDDDSQWSNAKTIATFGHGGAATIKIYRGEQALFFFAEVADTILSTEGETNDDAVTRSDSVEIYIDTLADGGLKPQNDDYQINLGIHGKTRIMQGSGSGWGGWNGLIDYEVQLNGVLNDGYEAVDTGYTVEIMIPYSQIGIEKDDTIAVSFGQVDKVASGSSATIDWDWYGWEYNGKIVEPQTPNNYLLLDKDNNVMSRDEESKPNADMAGYVVDYITGNPIAGATVTIASPEGLGIESVVTDEQGYYVFEKVNPEITYILSIEKENYFSNTVEYSRTELRDSNGGRVLKNVMLRNENDVEKTTVVGTVKNIVYGVIEGALVMVEGTTLSATTDANGIFTIEGVPAEESITLVVNHDLYDSSKTTVPAEMLVANGESNVGDVNINLPYALTGGFGNKSDKFASSIMYVSRTLTGIEMILEGTRKLDGKIEVYLDVKESADHRDQDATMWRFDLDSNGVIAVVDNYAAEGNGSAYGLEYKLYYNDSTGYSARFFIPYTYLGIAPLDVFGISLGQWSTTATDWDGWGFNGQFIAPELPKQFVRVSATNELYRQDNNTSMVNLSGNVGVSGVKVEVNGISTVTGANGAWNMKVARTSDAVNIVYSRQGYTSYTTTIPAGYFDTNYDYSENVTLEKQTVTLSGIVTNDRTGAPVVGATVSISGTDIAVITDENGKYTIVGLGTEKDVTLNIELEGYATKEESISAASLASQSSHTLNISLVEINYINYVTLCGKITNINGPVEGVRVSIVGNDELFALTNANGEFAIEKYPAVDCVIHIEKAGYISQDITMKADDIAKTATEHNIGEIDLLLEYSTTGEFANKSDAFAAFVGYVTRSKVGFEFKFVGSRPFTGRLELFIDTKASAGLNARDTSDYLFNLNADGTLTIVNWGEGVKNETIPANMVYTVKNADTTPTLTFTLPYDFFGQVNSSAALAPTEIIGISAGQWMGSDWDGWGFGEFVAPENPSNYVRISATNELYRHNNNAVLVYLSGNAGLSGVTVAANGVSVVTGEDGSWSMKLAKTSDAVNIVYSRKGYVSKTTTIPAGYFDANDNYSEKVTIEKQFVTLSGIVTNKRTGAPVVGVTVSIPGTDISVITDANGRYTIANLGTEADVTLKFEGEGYVNKEESLSAATLASQNSHTLDISLVESSNVIYVALSGKITNVNGPVEGASVSVVGNSELSAITNANGEFVINGYPVSDCVIHIEKAGYISQDITVKADDIPRTAIEYSVGEIDFLLEYARLQGVIADKSDAFAAFIGYVTRSKTGFEFKFVGSRAFTGQLEFFVDTKTSAADNARDITDYLFMLKADGSLQIVNWGEGVKNETIPANMVYTLENASSAPTLTFTLPYDFFGQVDPSMALAPTEVIGISAGQWMGTDWDGWDNFNLIGINNAEFVKPEWPQDYVRIAADNTLYSKSDNVTVDFSSYQIHFGTGMMTPQTGNTEAGGLGNAGLNADDMYAKVVKRDENGVTFEIITTGNFGMNTNTNEKEMILIYFDTGSVSNDGWNPDYLIKIASDGTVYGKANSAWWSASDADKLGTMATITTENGVTKIVYTVTRETLGVGATDVFGIAMREASHNAGDHMLYDPWHDCYFENETTGIDAAACTQFIRVSADGTLYCAPNNQ